MNIFKIELKRAFYNRLFVISLLIGSTISVLNVVFSTAGFMKYLYIAPHVYMISIFNRWIGDFGITIWSAIFFMIFPILATIPFADSFYTDLKSGYIKNIFTRGNKKHYYISKFISVFLSGGTVVVIPLILNIYLTSLCLPAVIPNRASQEFGVFGECTWSAIFYTHPFIYLLLYLLLIFFASAILATLALSFTYICQYRYVVTITPFICFMLIGFIAMFFSKPELDIRMWILPSQPMPMNLYVVIVELLILLILPGTIFFIKGLRDDTY